MKSSKILITVGSIIVFVAIFMFIYSKFSEYNAYLKSSLILEELKNDMNETNEKDLSLNVDGLNYIGIISIPSINIELPVMDNYKKLDIAPGRYYGSVEENNLIICAHGYKKFFKYIYTLIPGDVIVFRSINNNTIIYEVKEVEILNRDDIEGMIDNEFDLTLYTCTNDGLSRVTVRANVVTDS